MCIQYETPYKAWLVQYDLYICSFIVHLFLVTKHHCLHSNTPKDVKKYLLQHHTNIRCSITFHSIQIKFKIFQFQFNSFCSKSFNFNSCSNSGIEFELITSNSFLNDPNPVQKHLVSRLLPAASNPMLHIHL